MSLLLLGLLSGFLSTYLGLGSGLLLVSLLPFASKLSSLEILQLSLLVVFLANMVNVLVFSWQNLLRWSWLKPLAASSLISACLCGFFVSALSSLQMRFILFTCLLLACCFTLLRPALKKLGASLFYLAGLLTGACSGLTGLGGGLILSPFLHESDSVPVREIAGLVAACSLVSSCFSLLGLSLEGSLLLFHSSSWTQDFLYISLPAGLGIFLGHLLNIRKKTRLRRLIVRAITLTVSLFIGLDLLTRSW